MARDWDASGATSLRRNLEACLGLALPCPRRSGGAGDTEGGGEQDTADQDEDDRGGFRAPCAICYAYRLPTPTLDPSSSSGGAGGGGGVGTSSGGGRGVDHAQDASLIPEIVCTNTRCNRSYHGPCLSEWLRGLPTATRSFNTLFGHCPYCFVPISVSAR